MKKKAAKETGKIKKVKVIYIGQRENGDSIIHAFLHGKETLYFAKARYCIIGYEYFAEEKDGTFSIANRPESAGNEQAADPDQVLEWEALDGVAQTARKRRLLYNRLRKEKNLASEFPKLTKMAKGLSFAEKRIFADFLIDQMTDSVKKSG